MRVVVAGAGFAGLLAEFVLDGYDLMQDGYDLMRALADEFDLRLAGRRPNALEPGFHCARTRWIRGFVAFQLARRTRTVRLMVPVWPESGFRDRAAWPQRYQA